MRDLVPSRRHFLTHLAGLSALAASGSQFVANLHAAEKSLKKRNKSLIILWMSGGPSTIDLWDLKTGHANGGEFKPIKTSAGGVEISEHLPFVAKQMKHLAIVRSLKTAEGDHQRGTQLMNTGRSPNPLVQFPAIGSVLSQQVQPDGGKLPSFISVGGTAERVGPGFLGMSYAPFTVQNPGSPPENIKLPNGVSMNNLARRKELFTSLDLKDAEFLKRGQAAKSHNEIYTKAFDLVAGDAGKVFDLSGSKDVAKVEKYGNNGFGKGCLLARNLVEAGSVCVEVDLGGWDNHQNIFPTLKNQRLPVLDKAMAALVEDLVESGMWQDTVVLWMGDFGRTPRINQNAGRDHFPGTWSVVLGGGAIKGGQVYGTTEKDGMSIKDNPATVNDVFATVYKALGIDPTTQIRDNLGRPTAIAGDKAKPLSPLV